MAIYGYDCYRQQFVNMTRPDYQLDWLLLPDTRKANWIHDTRPLQTFEMSRDINNYFEWRKLVDRELREATDNDENHNIWNETDKNHLNCVRVPYTIWQRGCVCANISSIYSSKVMIRAFLFVITTEKISCGAQGSKPSQLDSYGIKFIVIGLIALSSVIVLRSRSWVDLIQLLVSFYKDMWTHIRTWISNYINGSEFHVGRNYSPLT